MDSSLWDAIQKVERRHWWFRGRRELVTALLRHRVPDGARVLDVGCGTGFVLERLLDHFDAWGLEPDISVRARSASAIAQRVLAGSTADHSSVESGSFDAVLLLDVLEHLDDDTDGLRSVLPLLRPKGVILLTVPAIPWLWSYHDVQNQHRRRYTRRSLHTLISSVGFTPSVLSYVNARLFPLALIHRAAMRILGASTMNELSVPPTWINEAFARVFSGEAKGALRGYPAGLSLVAVLDASGTPDSGG